MIEIQGDIVRLVNQDHSVREQSRQDAEMIFSLRLAWQVAQFQQERGDDQLELERSE